MNRNTSFKTDSDLEEDKKESTEKDHSSETSSFSEGDSDLNTVDYNKKRAERKAKKKRESVIMTKQTGAARKLLMNVLGAPPLQT